MNGGGLRLDLPKKAWPSPSLIPLRRYLPPAAEEVDAVNNEVITTASDGPGKT